MRSLSRYLPILFLALLPFQAQAQTWTPLPVPADSGLWALLGLVVLAVAFRQYLASRVPARRRRRIR
jgi:hypothetical protein